MLDTLHWKRGTVVWWKQSSDCIPESASGFNSSGLICSGFVCVGLICIGLICVGFICVGLICVGLICVGLIFVGLIFVGLICGSSLVCTGSNNACITSVICTCFIGSSGIFSSTSREPIGATCAPCSTSCASSTSIGPSCIFANCSGSHSTRTSASTRCACGIVGNCTCSNASCPGCFFGCTRCGTNPGTDRAFGSVACTRGEFTSHFSLTKHP
jgi:hypothetical protein